MNAHTALAALSGAGVGLGVLLMAAGLMSTPGAQLRLPVRWRNRITPRQRRQVVIRLGACAATVAVVAALTSWPVGAVLAGLAAWMLPRLVGRDGDHARALARIEAIAGWAEMLRDTLSAAAGFHQAIVASAPIAPAAIRPQVAALATRIEQGQRLPQALRQLADDLADPTADLVVAALVHASKRPAGQLGALLGALATAAREQASMRMRITAARARTRTSIRVIITVTVAMAAGLVVVNRGFLAPYDTAGGQLVLAGVGGVFAASLAWLTRLARLAEPERILAHPAPQAGQLR